MDILHQKRKLMPYGSPQEPVTAFIAANAATIATSAVVGAVGAAITGGNPLKGALMGAVFAGVGAAVSSAFGSAASSASSTLAPVSDATVMTASGGAELASIGAEQTAGQAATQAATQTAAQTAAPMAASTPSIAAQAGQAANGTSLAGSVANTSLSDQPLTTGLHIPSQGLSVTPAGTALSGADAALTSGSTALSAGGAASGGSTGLLSKIGNALTSERGIASMVALGGNALSGYAQAKAQQEAYERKQRDARYGTPVGRGLLWSN